MGLHWCTMLRWLQSFILREVVADVPADMALCLDCRKLECTEGDYQACAARRALAGRPGRSPKREGGRG